MTPETIFIESNRSDLEINQDTVTKYANTRAEFKNEVRSLKLLKGSYCPKLILYNTENLIIKMEFIKGFTLKEYLNANTDYNSNMEILVKIIKALNFFESFDLLHLDLHPGNIIVNIGNDGKLNVVIIDFGNSLIRGNKPNFSYQKVVIEELHGSLDLIDLKFLLRESSINNEVVKDIKRAMKRKKTYKETMNSLKKIIEKRIEQN